MAVIDEDDDPECTAVASRAELNAALALAAKEKKKQRPWIVIVTGSAGAGKMVRLDGEIVIGRVASAGFRIDEDGVSRQHAKLLITVEGAVQIVDLDSRNGTFVNGERVSRCDLHDGDKIQIGNTTILKFSYQDAMDEELQKNLYESATQDGLTRLANKKSFTEVLAREVSFAERHGRPLALVMFDVDHFKRVNDTYGHPAGDHVLRTLAQIVLAQVRAEDIVARVGGEEFAILLRDSNTAAAVHCAERVRTAVQGASIVFEGKPIPVTISLGIGSLAPGQHLTPSQLVAVADQHLYQAKQTGRNKVVAGV